MYKKRMHEGIFKANSMGGPQLETQTHHRRRLATLFDAGLSGLRRWPVTYPRRWDQNAMMCCWTVRVDRPLKVDQGGRRKGGNNT